MTRHSQDINTNVFACISNDSSLSFAESLRFEAIIESTVDQLIIAQTINKPNLDPSKINHNNHNDKRNRNNHKMSREDIEIYLRDNRLIDEHFNGLISLFHKTLFKLKNNKNGMY